MIQAFRNFMTRRTISAKARNKVMNSFSNYKIFSDILEGIQNKANVIVKPDRSDALITTFLDANKGDIILLAGKGHEVTQQIGPNFIPFSDRELAKRLTEVHI